MSVGGRKGKCLLEGGRQEGHVHPIGDRWRVVRSPGAGRGAWPSDKQKEEAFSGAGRERGSAFCKRRKSWEQVLGIREEKGVCIPWGVGIPLEGRRRGAKGREGGLRGVPRGDRVKTSLWRVRAGGSVFGTHT